MRIFFLILNLIYWAEGVSWSEFKVGKFQYFNGSADPPEEDRCQAVFLSKRVAITLRECGHTLATNGRPRDYRINNGATLKLKKTLMANALNGASPMVVLLSKDCDSCAPSSEAYFTWSNHKVEETIKARHYPTSSDISQGSINIIHSGSSKETAGFKARTATDQQTMMNEDKFGRIVMEGNGINFAHHPYSANSTMAKGSGIVLARNADSPLPERYELFGLFYDRCQPHLYSGDSGTDVSYCGIRFRHQSWLKICTGIEDKWGIKKYEDGLPRGCKEHWLRDVSKDHYGTNLLSAEGVKQVEKAIDTDAKFIGCVLRCFTDCPMAPAMPAQFDALHYRLDHFRKYHFFRYVDDSQNADNYPVITCKNAAGTKTKFSELADATNGNCFAPDDGQPFKDMHDLIKHGSKSIGAVPAGPVMDFEDFLFKGSWLCPAKPPTESTRRRRRSAKEMRIEAFQKRNDHYSYLNNHKDLIKRHKQIYQNKGTNDAVPDA